MSYGGRYGIGPPAGPDSSASLLAGGVLERLVHLILLLPDVLGAGEGFLDRPMDGRGPLGLAGLGAAGLCSSAIEFRWLRPSELRSATDATEWVTESRDVANRALGTTERHRIKSRAHAGNCQPKTEQSWHY